MSSDNPYGAQWDEGGLSHRCLARDLTRARFTALAVRISAAARNAVS